MYAVIKTGGKQYKVSVGDEIFVEKLEGEAGSIRHRAYVVADAHNGAIPNATFQHLKADIRQLDRNITRMS